MLRLGTSVVDAHCDSLADGTKCRWATTGLRRGHDGRSVWKTPNCKRPVKACNVDGFFAEHRETFELIKTVIDALETTSLTDELKQFSRVIGETLKDPTILLEYKSGCSLLADAIIAVDSESFRSFATQNYRESRVLTKILKQHCYYLPNNPANGVSLIED